MSEIIHQVYSGVMPNEETEIFGFTNETGKSIFLRGIGGESTGSGEWFIYVDRIMKIKRRNTAANINIDVNFQRYELLAGKSVQVKVIHYEVEPQDYSIDLRYSV